MTGSQNGPGRGSKVFAADELGTAWGVKERLRLLLATTELAAVDAARGLLGITVVAADTSESWKLWHTSNTWWEEIETRVINAKTYAASTAVKQIKRTSRGYRTHDQALRAQSRIGWVKRPTSRSWTAADEPSCDLGSPVAQNLDAAGVGAH